MGFRVKIRQFPEPIVVEAGDTILAAALAAGLDYPCGCQSGNCGACKSTLASGEVELSPYSEFALSEAERAAGLILACRAMPWSDCEVAYLEPDEIVAHPQRQLTCTLVALDRATHDIRRARLRIDSGGPFTFHAGQYAVVTFDGLAARDFSMANAPSESILEFHIRAIAGGAVSEYVHHKLKIGDTVRLAGPHGLSYLRESHTGPIVAFAGGSGLAPIKSIVERAFEIGLGQPIRLYFGARDERDIYLEDRFRGLAARHANFQYIPVLSAPSGATARRTGLLSEIAAADCGDLDGAKAYLAGPPAMVESCTAELRKRGLRREDCHADAFYTAADNAKLETMA